MKKLDKAAFSTMILKKFSAVALAAVMAVSGIACGRKPKEKVMDSFATVTEAQSAKALSKELGIADIMKSIEKGPFTLGVDLTLDDTDIYDLRSFRGASVNAALACDTKNEKMLLDAGIGYAGANISAQLYADDKQLAVSAPDLINKVFYVEFDNFLKNFKSSALAEMMDLSDDDFDALEEMLKGVGDSVADKKTDEITEYILGFEKEIKKFKDKIEVEETDKEEFEINGKDRKCEGYEMTVTKKSISDFVKSAIDYYFCSKDAKKFWKSFEDYGQTPGIDTDVDDIWEIIEYMEENEDEIINMVNDIISDINVEIYLYEGEIVYLNASTKIKGIDGIGSGGVKVAVTIECSGGDYSVYDNYKLSVKAMGMNLITLEKSTDNSDKKYSVEYSLSGVALEDMEIGCKCVFNKKKGDFDINATFDDGYDSIKFAVNGTLTVEKKKAINIEFDEICLSYDNGNYVVFSLSGECYIKCDAKASMPKGDKFNILTKKESDWQELIGDLDGLEDILDDLF